MAAPVVLVENVFSAIQFTGHTITASEEAAGAQAWRVADGRRSGLSAWSSTTANTAAWVLATFDRVRAFDMVVLDRGHNLAGLTFTLQASDDGTTFRNLVSLTMPAASNPGSVDDALGVVTEEGVWLKRFDLDTANYVRAYVPAMGAGLVPKITGLWVGKSLTLEYLDNPFEDDHREIVDDGWAAESNVGWRGRGHRAFRRRGDLKVKVRASTDEDEARYHLIEQFSLRPMWICHDADRAERTLCAMAVPGRLGLGFGSGDPQWGWRSGVLAFEEHEAKV